MLQKKDVVMLRSLAFTVALLVAMAASATAQVNSSWSAVADGNWAEAGKWTPPEVPNNGGGTTYVVTVDRTGTAYTIGLDANISVDSLTVNSADARINHTAGTMSAPLIDIQEGFYRLQGGTVSNSLVKSLVLGTTGRFVVMGYTTSFFDNVDIDRTVDVGSTSQTGGLLSSGKLRATNNLDLKSAGGGIWFQGGGGAVTLPGNQTISGVASGNQKSEIVFNQQTGYSAFVEAENGTLTIGPNVRVRVASGDYNTLGNPNEGLIIQGEVYSPVSIHSITITGRNWINQGLITQSGGGQVNLDGTFSTANLGRWSSDNSDINGRIRILGTLDNTNATLDLTKNQVTGDGGSMTLGGGGIINGGTVKAPSDATPFRTNAGVNGFGTLNGVTIDGFMSMEPGEVKVLNNLTVAANSVLSLNTSPVSTLARLTFAGNQTLGGSGGVLFQGTGGTPGTVSAEAGGTLTIGSSVAVRTGSASGNLGIGGSDLVNLGTISAETTARQINVTAGTLTSSGTLRVSNNSTMNLTATSIQNSGLLDVASGNLVNSSVIHNSGTVKGNGTISGAVDNSGRVEPGASAGVLTIGDLTQTATGKLLFEIAGRARGTQYDALVAKDILQLNGTIDLRLLGGFMPTAGATFDVLDWNTATFGSYVFDFSNASLSPGLAWDTSLFEASGQLQVVPEPSAMTLAVSALLAGCFLRRRWRFQPT